MNQTLFVTLDRSRGLWPDARKSTGRTERRPSRQRELERCIASTSAGRDAKARDPQRKVALVLQARRRSCFRTRRPDRRWWVLRLRAIAVTALVSHPMSGAGPGTRFLGSMNSAVTLAGRILSPRRGGWGKRWRN